MKKILMSVALIGTLVSCSNTKSTMQSSNPAPTLQTAPSKNPFGGETYNMPTFEPDTEEYFAASGIATGSRQRMDALQEAALANAQNIIRQKMKHAYKGMISNYTNYMGINSKSDAVTKIERGGNQIIDGIVNETMARDVRFSDVDEKGNVNCYVGIRIYKKQMADKLADQVSNDEELKIRFNENNYRKYIQEQIKAHNEPNEK